MHYAIHVDGQFNFQKVAWIHLDRHMIVAIHQHLVTRIPRYSASHDAHRNTWTLNLRGAQSVKSPRTRPKLQYFNSSVKKIGGCRPLHVPSQL